MIETLLPAVWDTDYCYGMPKPPTAPPADMPKGSTNKAHGNTMYAHLADINEGWAFAPLTVPERQAVLLRYGMDLTENEVGRTLDRPRSTVQGQIFRGVGKIVAHLNGTVFTETDGANVADEED